MGIEPKIGVYTPKMDGEKNGLNPIKMDDLGVPLFSETHGGVFSWCRIRKEITKKNQQILRLGTF